MAADVRIDIAAEFTGKKAFKQAETSADKLNKSVKKLAGRPTSSLRNKTDSCFWQGFC